MKYLLKKYKNLSIPAKASMVYIFANLFTRGLSIITTPIFTRIMTVEQIGVVNNFSAWSSILYVVVTLSLSAGGFSVAMMDFKGERNQYQASVLTLSSISVIVFWVIYSIAREPIQSFIGLDDTLMVIMFLNFLLYPAVDFWLQRSRFEQRYKNVAAFTIIQAVLSAFVSIIFVFIAVKKENGNTGDARMVGQFLVTLSFAAIIYVYTFAKGKTLYNRKFWKFAVTVNAPLIVHSLAKYILDISDRTMITQIVGLRAVGIYGTLYNVSSLSLIVWNSINAALIPIIFEKIKGKKEKELNSIIMPLIYIYGIVCIMLTLVAPEIVRILTTDEYYEAIFLMPPVAAGIFMTCVYNIYSNILMYHKKTIHIMISTVLAAVINVLLNYLLIPKYGYIAASYTTLLAYVLLAIFQAIMQKRITGKSIYNDKVILIVSVSIITLCLLINLLYKVMYIRYIVILVLLLIILLFRKKILLALERIKK